MFAPKLCAAQSLVPMKELLQKYVPAAAIFIRDSATVILAEAAGLISAIVGFSPYHESGVSASIRNEGYLRTAGCVQE